MSAALSQPLESGNMPSAGLLAEGVVGTGPRRRPVTAARWHRQVIAWPRYKRAQQCARVVSFGTERFVQVLCDLVAEEGESGIVWLDPDMDSMAEQIALQAGKPDGVLEVQSYLDALTRMGLVTEIEGGLKLPDEVIAKVAHRPASARRPASSGTAARSSSAGQAEWRGRGFRPGAPATRENWRDRGGPRRQGETHEQAVERRFQEDRNGGLPTGTPAQRSMPWFAPTSPSTSSKEVSPSPTSQLPANFKMEDRVEDKLGVSLAEVSTPDVVVAGLNPLKSGRNQQQQQRPGTKAAGAREQLPTSNLPSSEDSSKGMTALPTSAEANELGRECAAMFGFTATHAEQAPVVMQQLLDGGRTPGVIRAGLQKQKSTGLATTSARFLLKALPASVSVQVGAAGSAGTTRPPAPVTEPLHAGVDAVPEWQGLRPFRKATISKLLAILDMPPSQKRWMAASAAYQLSREDFDLVAARHPELQDVLDDGPDHGKQAIDPGSLRDDQAHPGDTGDDEPTGAQRDDEIPIAELIPPGQAAFMPPAYENHSDRLRREIGLRPFGEVMAERGWPMSGRFRG